jgi:hypothetical protein
MPLSADSRMILLRIKIERAKEHFGDLEREILACRGKTKRVMLGEDDPQTKQVIRTHLEELPVYPFTILVPIAKDRDTYDAEKAGKLKGIRPKAIEAIDALKPYKGGNDTLWRIHELDNIDKHRFVFVIAQDALFEAPWYTDIMPFLIRPRTLNTDAPLFSGAFDAEVENDVNFEIGEAVSQTQIGQSNALLPALRGYINVVEEIVESFRAYLS